ncbi:EamA domain-containing membrane protein RarD [Gemmobacter aquatilis]|uniref:EamA domain-containing membrane protein RarD n=1 Tax=Gemmobacter aquatilis TaxID=933059 RepID=A0A1H8J8G8_9RHOB|nr:DMT family transporter [Gemmobacter aquatilis]SEN76745.1 EamA domain-containing membrane protein RarD [Gemmobacter aquatilis]
MTQNRPLPGAALMIAFCILAPLLDVCSKLATAAIPVGEVTLARFVVQGALMLPVALVLRLPLWMGRRVAGLLLARAVFLVLSTYCFIAGIAVMPLADALALVFVEPFILLILGKLLFGDEVGPRRIAASIVGFGGAMLVIQPAFATFGLVTLYPLGTAFLFAFYMLITRAIAAHMHPVTMQLHTALTGTALCLPVIWLANGSGIAALDPVMPQGIFWLWLFGVGFWATVSHMCMTYALKFAPSATLAPLHYFELVVAVALGYLVFGDFPNMLTWAGITIITGSGLYIIWREQRGARRAAAEALSDAGF